MKILPLRPFEKGVFALVDDGDYEVLKKYKWYRSSTPSKRKNKPVYAMLVHSSRKGTLNIPMHRIVANAEAGVQVDHIDGNPLNNTRSNLRKCSHAQNLYNIGPNSMNKTGYKGVSWIRASGKYAARIQNRHLGTFPTKEAAAEAYNNAAMKLHGQFAKLNKPKHYEVNE